MTNKFDVTATYRQFVERLNRKHSRDIAMKNAPGGEFEVVGILERELLIQCGLKPDGYLIDVGCGSGRLAKPLAEYLRGMYLGIDVVPDMLKYARSIAGRDDWRFEIASGLTIPEKEERADMVCFFSVFTHLLHEQSFAYLRDARRVLKPGGSIVFSFLEFAIPSHWAVFESNVADIGGSQHLNMFMDRDGIRAWARHLDLEIVALHDGDKPHIPIPRPLTLENGTTITDHWNLGQSVAVLRKG